ncbi:uncharacterized protein LOC129808287 [Phlebotomus papatasi]|uniref:uncharacterized protein LOC129808287 n=1 Tax=Phlebotomus papatasi TaxID=29031 RepID=UPI00248430CA|nr:uncharacterized protein LOC129808287 [Phlebotomus papatasi]
MVLRTFSVGESREYLLKRCAFMGLDVFLRDGRKNLWYYLCFWVPMAYQICCFYTLYLERNNPVIIMQCLSVWGAAGQASLNPDPSAGFPDYEIQVAIHVACLFVGINELVALDGLYTYFIFNAASMADGLIIHVRNMSSQVRQNSINDTETRKCIKHLAQLHREYMDYVKRLDKMYYVMVLMQFGSFALSGSVGLYAARVSDWYAVYGIVFTSVFQLFFFCSLGSVIENKNTEISEELYGANWAEMSVENRRMILFMLHHAKNANTISVGHLSPLNLETGMSTYRILYSYFLLLQDAVKV